MVLILIALYVLSALGLSLYGFNTLVLFILYWHHRQKCPATPETPRTWPSVVVQLPVYNESHVIERLVSKAAALDYPKECLTIQVLDDSTDGTSAIAKELVESHRSRGVDIHLVRRRGRSGFKAGALAYGMVQTDAEFVAIFDADFLPPADFLRRVIPYLVADPHLGIVQARWSHINADYNHLTRAQALALDSHFVVEQIARNRGGLLMNFNGSAGVLRRACIEDSGGWQSDTLSEDMDLSYRAQLAGWGCLYLPDVDVPAEIPPTITAFKRQQARWAAGTIQCLRKLAQRALLSHLGWWQKVETVLHLSGYLVHPLMLVMLFTSVPLMLSGSLSSLPLAPLGLASLVPPLMALVSQRLLYPDWRRRLAYFPLFLLMGVGIAVSNTWAVWLGLQGKKLSFQRTPKFHLNSPCDRWVTSAYARPAEYTTWIELALALYAGLATPLALTHSPGLAALLVMYMLGFGYIGGLGLWQAGQLYLEQRGVYAEAVNPEC